jgi:hypothetical protein
MRPYLVLGDLTPGSAAGGVVAMDSAMGAERVQQQKEVRP